jgi:urea carboxylase-associated protein 1
MNSMDVGAIVVLDEAVPARKPWGGIIRRGQVLRIIDLEGQQAVDFLCYDADNPDDRYSSANTIKVQGNVYVGPGTVLYADSGNPLLTVTADTIGRHDTVYGCCSRANNRLRYGVDTTESCYDNFTAVLARFSLDERAIVSNINFFMSVPIDGDGKAGIADGVAEPGHYVELRAERDVIAVLSNCPQMHNPCNGYNPTPVRVIVREGDAS